MELQWDRKEALALLSSGEYDGYIKDAITKLRSKLPLPLAPWDDFYQEFSVFCMEAIEKFKPERGAKFTTFLYKHLNLRSHQWFNWAWMPKNHEAGQWTYSFSQLESRDYSGTTEERKFDPADRTNVLFSVELLELKANLSPRNRELFEYFCSYLNWEKEEGYNNLIPAFSSDSYASKVQTLTTIDQMEVRNFVNEVSRLTAKHVELPR